MLASRYAAPDLAHRQLEQVVSAVLLASAPRSAPEMPAAVARGDGGAWRQRARDRLPARWSTTRPGFVDYWQAGKPIDEIGAAPHRLAPPCPARRAR